ncbi:PREDICTED: anoctamin-7 [Gekko japonicus]|uniref:Anoctamin n=1 Tax=Gekko japonicus TaxID=146911 RepID=A0ABM1K2X9_GEKJA|nr:PREDICTED: anoctamin-7 [Gekko japonicus]
MEDFAGHSQNWAAVGTVSPFPPALQAHPNPDSNTSDALLRQLRLPNPMAQPVPNKPLDFYTCAFRKSKLDRFLGSDSPDSYFSSTQRHRIVYEILTRTVYGKRKHAEVGLDRLLNEGVYSAAFPLHEGPFELPEYEVPGEELNPRQILYCFWAQWRCWYKYQPLDHIREYFGEKVAIYFAWLGFYTTWLLPAAAVGTFVFLAGLFAMGTNTPAQEICNSGGQFLMCPLCDSCGNWNLSEICSMAKVGYLFDHPGTVFFSIFMSFWAVAFLEYWKRKNATLAHHWDCLDFQEEEAGGRPFWLSGLGLAKLKAWRQKRKLARVQGGQIGQEPKRWEEDFELIECEGLFEEYLEMVLQFGFITIFVAAFPLAPLFALLNNWVEIRLDAQKFVCEYRRPVAERAQGISVWFFLLDVLAHISVIVNAFLIAFTSDFLPRLPPPAPPPPRPGRGSLLTCPLSPPRRYKAFRDASGSYTLFYWKLLAVRLGFIITFEHVVFFCLRLIDWVVPDVPESLGVKIKRERYLAKQALADNQAALLTQAPVHPAARPSDDTGIPWEDSGAVEAL